MTDIFTTFTFYMQNYLTRLWKKILTLASKVKQEAPGRVLCCYQFVWECWCFCIAFSQISMYPWLVEGRKTTTESIMCSAKTKCTLVRIKLAIAFCYAMNFEMFKLDLEKAEKPEIKKPPSTRSKKKQENFWKISTSASLTTQKPFTVWITTNCGNFIFWIGLSGFIRESQDYKGLESWHWGPSPCHRRAQHWQSAGCTACASRSGLSSSFSPVWPLWESDLWLS